MVGFNVMFVFSIHLYLSKVLDCVNVPTPPPIKCPAMQLENGQVTMWKNQTRIFCNKSFRLVRGKSKASCAQVNGQWQWDIDSPICAAPRQCNITKTIIPNGRLDIRNAGASLEVKCNLGYTIDGPSFIYCKKNGLFFKWSEELKGCKEIDQIYSSCDFELSYTNVYTLCRWEIQLAIPNYIDHVVSGSSKYLKNNYILLDAENYGSPTTGQFSSPLLPPVKSKQMCLIFAYKLTSEIPNNLSELKVSFGDIPHWKTQNGEGRAIIGLYQLNIYSKIIFEVSNCKAAIDNIIVTEGNSCYERPYEEETDSCLDNCGIITVGRCSCDWECHNINNCCPDIQSKCPYIKPIDVKDKLYLSISTTATPIMFRTTLNNTTSIVSIFKKIFIEHLTNTPINDIITIDQVTASSKLVLMPMTNLATRIESITLNTTNSNNKNSKSTLAINPTYFSINPYSITLNTTTTENPKSTLAINPTYPSIDTHSTTLNTTNSNYKNSKSTLAINPTYFSINPYSITLNTTTTENPKSTLAINPTYPSIDTHSITLNTTATENPKTILAINPTYPFIDTYSITLNTTATENQKTTLAINPTYSSIDTYSTTLNTLTSKVPESTDLLTAESIGSIIIIIIAAFIATLTICILAVIYMLLRFNKLTTYKIGEHDIEKDNGISNNIELKSHRIFD